MVVYTIYEVSRPAFEQETCGRRCMYVRTGDRLVGSSGRAGGTTVVMTKDVRSSVTALSADHSEVVHEGLVKTEFGPATTEGGSLHGASSGTTGAGSASLPEAGESSLSSLNLHLTTTRPSLLGATVRKRLELQSIAFASQVGPVECRV